MMTNKEKSEIGEKVAELCTKHIEQIRLAPINNLTKAMFCAGRAGFADLYSKMMDLVKEDEQEIVTALFRDQITEMLNTGITLIRKKGN